jgi:Protein of unknown function (DUF3455)
MRKHFRVLLSAALFAAASATLPFSLAAQAVPDQLRPPASDHLLFQLHAKGDQIYVCKPEGAQFTWTLKAPDARLFDRHGKPFGKHFAGPTWQANDGSSVVGKAVAKWPSPDADSVAWLLVTVISHQGHGALSRVTTIQRVNTKGGQPPASGCDAARVGQEFRAPYSAEYRFFAPK